MVMDGTVEITVERWLERREIQTCCVASNGNPRRAKIGLL